MTAVWFGLGWLAFATVVAVVIGKAIRRGGDIDRALSTYTVEIPDYVPAGWAA